MSSKTLSAQARAGGVDARRLDLLFESAPGAPYYGQPVPKPPSGPPPPVATMPKQEPPLRARVDGPQGPPPPPPNMSPEDARKFERIYGTTPEAKQALTEKFGLTGILEALLGRLGPRLCLLQVVRMHDPHLNTLALGLDLTGAALRRRRKPCGG